MASKKQSLVGAKLVGNLSAAVGTLTLDLSLFAEALNLQEQTVDVEKLKDAFEKYYWIRPETHEIDMKGFIRYLNGETRLEIFDMTPQKRKLGTKKPMRSKIKAKRRKGK